MRRIHKKLITSMVVTVFATLGLASSAGAVSSAPATANVPVVNLTAAEKQALQAEVNEQMKDYGGGKQISINQIAYYNGRMIITLPLPGETKARAIDEPVTPQGVAACGNVGNACLWSDTNFNGQRSAVLSACIEVQLAAPFNTSTGSIYNHQTTGTQTILLNSAHQILNASMAESRINDTGVGTRFSARFWRVCP